MVTAQKIYRCIVRVLFEEITKVDDELPQKHPISAKSVIMGENLLAENLQLFTTMLLC